MASAWIENCVTARGETRYRVMFRVGGRETRPQYAGKFRLKKDARTRRDWVRTELAAMRVPDLTRLKAPRTVRTFEDVMNDWHESRIDVSSGTALQHRTALARCKVLFPLDVQEITAQDVAALVADLHTANYAADTIRKSWQAVAMVLDFADRDPNPARDRTKVKLPSTTKDGPTPPDVHAVSAVAHRLPIRYLIALAALDLSGARISELENARLKDWDERNARWLVRATGNKNRRPEWRWITDELVDGTSLESVLRDRLPAHEDRNPEDQLLADLVGDRLRTAINRACRDAGVPQFSPHDLRHRRISLLHRQGVDWARIGQRVGQKDLATTANTYTHVILDPTEVNWSELLRRARSVPTSVPTLLERT